MTLCAVFTLSPFLARLFDPPLWIAVTTSFVMENQSASAISTSLLRLVGTVLVSYYVVDSCSCCFRVGVGVTFNPLRDGYVRK